MAYGLVAGFLVGLSMWPYLDLNAQNGLQTHSLQLMNRYSASLTDFFIPSIKQFLWGNWIDRTFHPGIFQEATLYIGAVAFVLAIIAWVKRRQFRYPELLDIAMLVAAAGFVLALGIQLHWLGTTKGMPKFYLPSYYLYRYLPYFSKMRVMMRFGLFTLIFTSLMAGLGTYLLTKIGLLQCQALGRDRPAGAGLHRFLSRLAGIGFPPDPGPPGGYLVGGAAEHRCRGAIPL